MGHRDVAQRLDRRLSGKPGHTGWKRLACDLRGELHPGENASGLENRVPSYLHSFLPILASIRDYQQENGGMKFVKAAEGGPADKAGFKTGDVLIEYGGRLDNPVDCRKTPVCLLRGREGDGHRDAETRENHKGSVHRERHRLAPSLYIPRQLWLT